MLQRLLQRGVRRSDGNAPEWHRRSENPEGGALLHSQALRASSNRPVTEGAQGNGHGLGACYKGNERKGWGGEDGEGAKPAPMAPTSGNERKRTSSDGHR